jgi:hypothetical protein
MMGICSTHPTHLRLLWVNLRKKLSVSKCLRVTPERGHLSIQSACLKCANRRHHSITSFARASSRVANSGAMAAAVRLLSHSASLRPHGRSPSRALCPLLPRKQMSACAAYPARCDVRRALRSIALIRSERSTSAWLMGFAEIKTAKIEPVDLAAVGDAEFGQPPHPRMILLLVRRSERDVVHGAGALPGHRQILLLDHVEFGPLASVCHRRARGCPQF